MQPMRMLVGVILVLPILYAGEWAYRNFLRPIDEPTPALRALATHFNSSGVRGDFYPVRHGFRHSSVKAVIAYKIDCVPIPFAVVHCPSEISAERRLQSSPPEWMAQRNGPLVVHFDMWGDDMKPFIDRVSRVFLAFKLRS